MVGNLGKDIRDRISSIRIIGDGILIISKIFKGVLIIRIVLQKVVEGFRVNGVYEENEEITIIRDLIVIIKGGFSDEFVLKGVSGDEGRDQRNCEHGKYYAGDGGDKRNYLKKFKFFDSKEEAGKSDKPKNNRNGGFNFILAPFKYLSINTGKSISKEVPLDISDQKNTEDDGSNNIVNIDFFEKLDSAKVN